MNKRNAWRLGVILIPIMACDLKPIDLYDPGDPPGPEWEHCPSTDSFVGPVTGEQTLLVTNDALYCEYPAQNAPLEKALALNQQLRFVAGQYPLPEVGQTVPFGLPICLRDADGPLDGVAAGTAEALDAGFFDPSIEWMVLGSQDRMESEGSIRGPSAAQRESANCTDGMEGFMEAPRCGAVRPTIATSDQSLFASCTPETTTCDTFVLDGNSSPKLDQTHWVDL